MIYPVKNKTEADKLRERIQSVVREKELFIPAQAPPGNSVPLTQAENASAPITDHLEMRSNIKCVIDYIFDPVFDSALKLKNSKTNKQFYISFSCSGPARAKYF